jgi:hypothetical protein
MLDQLDEDSDDQFEDTRDFEAQRPTPSKRG